MGYKENMAVRAETFNNEAIYDAFARARVSEPYTQWESKLLGDNRALFWDDVETAGGGTSSTYNANESSVTLAVSDSTIGTRVRQTKQRFNYQAGKSRLVMLTTTFGEAQTGITRRAGYFDDKNGAFFELEGNTISVVKRSFRSGVVVDTRVTSAEWNLNKLLTEPIDPSKSLILGMDMEWLGVGSLRFFTVVDGAVLYLHQLNHANDAAGVYMTTPNLPIRYEISNDGRGGAAEMECICSTVISEGGAQLTGATLGLTTVPTHVDANTADTMYAVIGVRLKSTHLDNIVKIRAIEALNQANADFYWVLLLNPTIAGTFAYADVNDSPIQAAYGATANTVTGGHPLVNGLSTSANVARSITDSLLYIGSKVDGTPDEVVLCVVPLSANADIQGTMTIEYT